MYSKLVFISILVAVIVSTVMASMDSTPEELVREARDMLTKRLNVGQLPRDKRGIFGMFVDLCSALIGLFPFLGPIVSSALMQLKYLFV
jgi:hypothetical protein